jgi:hypothetical protein
MASPDYGTTPNLGIRYIKPTGSLTLISDIDTASQAMALDVEAALIPPVVSALPGTPFDGQQILYLADATAGVIWHLRYRASSASAYKWEYVGGPPLVRVQGAGGAQTTANVATFTPMTASPSLTLPLAGSWDVRATGDLYDGGVSADVEARVQLTVNGVQTFPVGWLLGKATTSQFAGTMCSMEIRTGSSSAGDVLALSIATSGTAVVAAALVPWTLRATPVRLG